MLSERITIKLFIYNQAALSSDDYSYWCGIFVYIIVFCYEQNCFNDCFEGIRVKFVDFFYNNLLLFVIHLQYKQMFNTRSINVKWRWKFCLTHCFVYLFDTTYHRYSTKTLKRCVGAPFLSKVSGEVLIVSCNIKDSCVT